MLANTSCDCGCDWGTLHAFDIPALLLLATGVEPYTDEDAIPLRSRCMEHSSNSNHNNNSVSNGEQ